MDSQVTVTKVVEGASHLVIKVDLASLGVGELDHEVILTPADLNPVELPNPKFRIMQIWYGLVWFDVSLGSSTVSPVPLWTAPRDSDTHTDFRSFGGLYEQRASPPPDANGKLWISTNGFNVAGSRGTFVLELRKTYQPQ